MGVEVTVSEDEMSYIISDITLEDDTTYFVVQRVQDWDTIDRKVNCNLKLSINF